MFTPLRRLLRKLAAKLGNHVVVRVRSGVAEGARWTVFPWSAYWRGTHEPAVQQELMRLGGGDIAGWVCWDLGAHYGIYSVGLARRVGPAGQVVAFEPNPLSFARLSRHKALNDLPQLVVLPVAVSDEERRTELFTYGELDSTATHLRYEGEQGVGGQPIEVATVRLDALVEAGRIRAPRFVKVDVEGHGHRALAGARATIAASRPVLLIGLHSPEEERGILAILEPLGYRRTRVNAEDYLFTPAG